MSDKLKSLIQRDSYIEEVTVSPEDSGIGEELVIVLRRLSPRELLDLPDSKSAEQEDHEVIRAMLLSIKMDDEVLPADDIDFDILHPHLYKLILGICNGLLGAGVVEAGKVFKNWLDNR